MLVYPLSDSGVTLKADCLHLFRYGNVMLGQGRQGAQSQCIVGAYDA